MTFNPQFQKVGDILVYHNVITDEQLQKALTEQKKTKEKLGQILINQGIINEAQLVKAYSEQMGHKHVLENDLLILSEDNFTFSFFSIASVTCFGFKFPYKFPSSLASVSICTT